MYNMEAKHLPRAKFKWQSTLLKGILRRKPKEAFLWYCHRKLGILRYFEGKGFYGPNYKILLKSRLLIREPFIYVLAESVR